MSDQQQPTELELDVGSYPDPDDWHSPGVLADEDTMSDQQQLCGEILTESRCVRRKGHERPHTEDRRWAALLDERDRLREDYAGFLEALTRALNDAGVPAMPSWPEAVGYLVAERDRLRDENERLQRDLCQRNTCHAHSVAAERADALQRQIGSMQGSL